MLDNEEELTEIKTLWFCLQGIWIRQGAVGFISALTRTFNIADVHCKVLHALQPCLKKPVLQVDKEVTHKHRSKFITQTYRNTGQNSLHRHTETQVKIHYSHTETLVIEHYTQI